MKRKEYLKPEMKVVQLKSRTQLLVDSLTIYKNKEFVEDDDDIL